MIFYKTKLPSEEESLVYKVLLFLVVKLFLYRLSFNLIMCKDLISK
jgi:hypothetical protein